LPVDNRIAQHCRVAEDELALRQWAEPRIAALGESRRAAAVALAVASRHLAKLTDYLAAAGKDHADASRLLDKAWAALDEQEQLTVDDLFEFCSGSARPVPLDALDDERQMVMMASEAFIALIEAVHCVIHGRAGVAVNVLESGRMAALLADGVEGAARELALQRRQVDAAASISGMQDLVKALRCQGDA
jgi:hypothetical protein